MKRPLMLCLHLLLVLSVSLTACGKVKDGTKKEYYKSGELLSVSTFKNFRRHGPYKEYHKNGQLKLKANFIRGKIDGVVKSYDKDGRLATKEIYEDGEIVHRNVIREE